MRIAPACLDAQDERFVPDSGYFAQPVQSPLPDLEKKVGMSWEWYLRPEIPCLDQWLDFNA